jgi:hypothetical protein
VWLAAAQAAYEAERAAGRLAGPRRPAAPSMVSIKAWIRGNGAARTREAISGTAMVDSAPAGQVRRALGIEGRGVRGRRRVRDQRFGACDLVDDLAAIADDRHGGCG